MTMKTCKRCGKPKLLDLFPLSGSPYSKDGHQNTCKDCRLLERAERKAARDAEPGGEAEATAEPDNRPRMTMGVALGFDVVLQGEDFHVSQDNGGEVSTVIFTPHELRRLFDWAEEQARAQQPAQATDGGV